MSAYDRGFWLGWIGVTTAGLVIVLLVAGALPPIAGGAFAGLVMGLAQWSVLRQRVTWARQWVWATAAGYFMPYAVFGAFADLGSGTMRPAVVLLAGYMITGTVVGACQWTVMRGRLERPAWWVLANMAAFVIGLMVAIFALLIGSIGARSSPGVTQILFAIILALVVGLITGRTMVSLLNRPLRPSP